MLITDRHAPLESPDATSISYSLLRHLGFMLDELSAQGLTLWQDEGRAWRWAWAATAFQSERGFGLLVKRLWMRWSRGSRQRSTRLAVWMVHRRSSGHHKWNGISDEADVLRKRYVGLCVG